APGFAIHSALLSGVAAAGCPSTAASAIGELAGKEASIADIGSSLLMDGNLPYVMPRHNHSIGPKRYRCNHQLLTTTCAPYKITVGSSPTAGPIRPYKPVV